MAPDIATNPPASAGAAGVDAANPPGYETGAGAADADQGQASQSVDDLPDESPAEGEQAPEFDEVEHEGLKHQIPKALREIVDKGLDYTRKTQELAETSRAREQQFAEQEQQFAHREQAAAVLQQGRAALAAVDLQLKPYEGVNWVALNQQDPVTANQHYMQYQTLKEQRQQIAGGLQQAESNFTQHAERLAIQRVQAIEAKWTQDEQKAVIEAAREYNLTRPVLINLFGNNPGLLGILRDAAMHRAATKSATAAVSRSKAAAPATQPAAQLPQGGRTVSLKPLSDPSLSDAEWLRRRNEQIRKSRRR